MADASVFDFDGAWGRQYCTVVEKVIPGYPSIFPMALAYLKTAVPDQGKILVVGAGGGSECLCFCDEPWHITGVDPSPTMLRWCREKIAQRPARAITQLVEGYVSDLPDTAAYDAATCILVMHFLPDDGTKQALLRDIAQRLVTGAVYIHVDAYASPLTSDNDRKRSIIQHYLTATHAFPDLKAQQAYLRQTVSVQNHIVTETRLRELFRSAGFEDIQQFYLGMVYGGWVMRRSRR